MKRLLLVAALAVAGATTGCDLSPPAATVAGTTITRSELNSQLAAIYRNSYTQCALNLQGVNTPTSLSGSGDGTVSSTFASIELSTLVITRLAEADLARAHHPVTAADVQAAADDFVSQLSPGTGSPCGLEGAQLVQRLPRRLVDQQVRYLAAQEQLAAVVGHVDVSTAALERYYQAHPTDYQEICLSGIVVTTQADAQQIHDAVTSGGTTFEAAASKSSIDTQSAQNGGKLACVAASTVVNSIILGAINSLSPGQVSQPVFEPQAGATTPGTSGVWLLLRLDGRPVVPFAQAQSQIRQKLLSAQNPAVSAEFTRLIRTAHVDVDPRYGSWNPQIGVRPPPVPDQQDLLTQPGALGQGVSG